MVVVVEKNPINNQGHKFSVKHKGRKGFAPLEACCEGGQRGSAGLVLTGFTLFELLVVLGIVSVLMGILLPVLGKARRKAGLLLCMRNQREILRAVNLFATDNEGTYPESVATIGAGSVWHWAEPTTMTGCMARSPQIHRSVSAYLRSYIEDASIMFCPSAPSKYKYLQQAWDAGDEWDNPETPTLPPPLSAADPVKGTYCFYWNYMGYLEGREYPFKGPRYLAGGRGRSRLLVSDYFGYDHWRSRNAYGSCERFKGANIAEGSLVSSAYWSVINSGEVGLDTLKIKLHGGYADGHVERYGPAEVTPMWVSIASDGTVRNTIPGIFYLPRDALH